MSNKDKRFAIWGVSGFIAWSIFIIQGNHHHHSLLEAFGVSLVWGIVSVFSIATLIHLRAKK